MFLLCRASRSRDTVADHVDRAEGENAWAVAQISCSTRDTSKGRRVSSGATAAAMASTVDAVFASRPRPRSASRRIAGSPATSGAPWPAWAR